jgi:hypothetical protein
VAFQRKHKPEGLEQRVRVAAHHAGGQIIAVLMGAGGLFAFLQHAVTAPVA